MWGRTNIKVVVKCGHSYSHPAGDWWPVWSLILPFRVLSLLWTPGTHLDLFQSLRRSSRTARMCEWASGWVWGSPLGEGVQRHSHPVAWCPQCTAGPSEPFIRWPWTSCWRMMDGEGSTGVAGQAVFSPEWWSVLSTQLCFQAKVSDPSRGISSNKYIKKISQGQLRDFLRELSFPIWWKPSVFSFLSPFKNL